MFMETQTLRARLHQLRQTGLSLADLLMLDADRLDSQGWPPSRTLSDDLRSFREQISSLTSLLHAGLDEHSPRYESLTEMADELDYRDMAMRATAIARQLVRIQCAEGQLPAGLKEIQDAAAEMIATLGLHAPRELIHTLDGGHHSWCDLLRMIREGGTLSDSEWTQLNSSIETAFGRPLAVSAARGRLVSPPLAEPKLSPIHPAALAPVAPLVEESVALDHALDTRGADFSSEMHGAEPLGSPMTESPANPLEGTMSALRHSLRSSVLERAVAKSRSESSAIREIRADASESISEAPLSPVNEIDFVHSSVVQVEPSIAAIHTPIHPPTPQPATDPVEVSNHSVFDEIELVSLPHKYDSPTPVAKVAEAKAKPVPMAAPRQVSSSSIFEDDADEADELISDRNEDLPGIPVRESGSTSRSSEWAPSPLAEQLLAQARFVDATGTSARLATTILNGPESDRVQLIPDLIFHLIHEGRPGLAYHLSRSLESQSGVSRPFVPSWLIRTWTFGHALVFPKGQLAGQLQDDLQCRTISVPRNASADWNMAISLMVRAATLRPAIIAPFTRAASVLRDFELQSGCVQLYNYCSRIGASGERIQGVFPGLFKQTIASVPYSDQLSALRADIARWRDSSEVLTKKFQIATQLFQKTGWSLRAGMSQRHPNVAFDWMNWQMALRMVESLVAPVTEDRRTELSSVKAMVEEISIKLAADESGDGRRHLSQPEIRAYLRQATTFAQRWIGLHSGAATSAAQNYLPQAAVELRSDILHRHSQVMEELQTLATEHMSFEVRMAVACLMLSVQEIRDLVDPNIVTDTREPDPRHLLHSELLKIPNLSLSASWEPETDFHTLEDEILNFLSQPQPDWTTAFQMQMAQDNHQMADHILSLAIWTNEERDALQGVLERDRGRQRTDFSQELQNVQKLLHESVHLDILQETERAGFETRLIRLQRILATDSDISSGILELGRVKDSLVKRREREADRIRTRLRRLSGPPDDSPAPPQGGGPSPGTAHRGEWVMDFDRSPP